MREYKINVIENTNERLDAYISKELEQLSRNRTSELIKDGFVLVNEEIKKAKYKPVAGDVIHISIPEATALDLIPQDLNLDIVFEDSSVVVVNKPSGMVVHPSLGHAKETLVNGLLHAVDDLSGINGQRRPGIVHRIDKDTSGLLMVAKNDHSHEHLSQQLKAKTVKREYIALVHGVIDHERGKIDAPIGRDGKDRIRFEVVEHGKPSVTHFEVLERFKDYTLVKCRLETGRTHQIRVHMRYIGHPLVGDPFYGPRKTISSDFGQYLHALTIGFNHPVSGEFIEFTSELPLEFQSLLTNLREK